MFVPAAALARLPAGLAEKALEPWDALIIRPNHRTLPAWVRRFKQLGAGRCVYVHADRPDRYLAGFYPRAVGADGCYFGGVFIAQGGPYTGFHLDGGGLLVPQSDNGFAPTLALLRLWQGRQDGTLMQTAEEMLEKAAKAQVAATELETALARIRDRALKLPGVRYSAKLMRTSAVSHAEMDSWRGSLLDATAEYARRLGKKP